MPHVPVRLKLQHMFEQRLSRPTDSLILHSSFHPSDVYSTNAFQFNIPRRNRWRCWRHVVARCPLISQSSSCRRKRDSGRWVWAVEHRTEGQLSGHSCADFQNEKEPMWEQPEAEWNSNLKWKKDAGSEGWGGWMQWAAGGEIVGLERKWWVLRTILLLNSTELLKLSNLRGDTDKQF